MRNATTLAKIPTCSRRLEPRREAEHEQQVMGLDGALVERILELQLGREERARRIRTLPVVERALRTIAAVVRVRRRRVAIATAGRGAAVRVAAFIDEAAADVELPLLRAQRAADRRGHACRAVEARAQPTVARGRRVV